MQVEGADLDQLCRGMIEELARLAQLYEAGDQNSRKTYDTQISLLVDKLSNLTRITYNAAASQYCKVRGPLPNEEDKGLIDELLRMVSCKRLDKRLSDHQSSIHLLDVGTGHGRDLRYLSRLQNVKPIGVDNSEAFIEIMDGLALAGEIPKGSYYRADMRQLFMFEDSSFDAIRINTSLQHLPMLPNRMGADEAVSECFRVLKPHGVLYVSVKAGEGLACMDTMEGLGVRVHQYHTENSLRTLLTRNGFSVFDTRFRTSKRPTGPTQWIIMFAERAFDLGGQRMSGSQRFQH